MHIEQTLCRRRLRGVGNRYYEIPTKRTDLIRPTRRVEYNRTIHDVTQNANRARQLSGIVQSIVAASKLLHMIDIQHSPMDILVVPYKTGSANNTGIASGPSPKAKAPTKRPDDRGPRS
ncbi:unnamed protein product [Rhizoctonia solani]|uniref:Uncharacterized protein n=1 Tax=Rhizoctonia solani TaxID=456999 RepID=A0A8H3GTY6_9AGAM|nr:unnamed protein product [Rhizoctonia solani]